ncbi:MAG: DEAD/DEAH box helicase [Acidimicrobiales bacterium]|nr:DEAD/DEAH box helicase [Acidimicrobiales bacterium]MYG61737.1 DEAD/DEAH box helicase [Acidimicrobiales bacterium]MYJ47411.1 DEAD/DEAH box helicase [Acidimicrobiales bacterium]
MTSNGSLVPPLFAELLIARGIAPDGFQAEAFAALDRGDSVLVAAPTSSGKTLVAEYGIAATLEAGKRVAYTAPTKALSNQKLRELRSWLGSERVGLLTGDNVICPDADVVVMTTEVLRNMMYAGSPHIAQFGMAVLDEVHYLQDPYRGAVWEEVIISTPRHMRLVCLSATVSNAHELASWVEATAGGCTAVVCSQRPVPLEDRFLLYERQSRRLVDLPTLRDGRPNPEIERIVEQARSRSGGQRRHRRAGARPARPRRSEIIEHLAASARLPAIVFVFSRQGCDDAAGALIADGASFLDAAQQRRVRQIASAHTADLDGSDLDALRYDEWLEQLTAGVAAHHAGLIPVFKEAIEECFSAGLLAVVFATETLAVGVNMPARSVVIEQLSRFRGEGFALLTPGEYTQLTGRAGRRGIDETGYAYTLWHPQTAFGETARLVASGDFELESSFRPTYNMVANLIAGRTHDEAVELLQRSFAQWRADRRVGQWTAELEEERRALREARARLRSMGGGRGRSQSHAPARGRSSGSGRHRRGKPADRRTDRALVDAERHAERVGARVSRLKDRIKLAKGGLSRQLDATNEVLNIFGCADGWSLTATGDCLKAVFHECDLLTVLCLRDGVFDGVAPAQLAGLVSVLTYEHRSSQPPPPPRYPDNDSRERAAHMFELASQINTTERQHSVVPSRPPDASFFAVAHAWAGGTAYTDLWHGEAAGDQMPSGGDFVRQMRQLIDLVDRIAGVAPQQRTRRTATDACSALDRGVVAAAARVSDSRVGGSVTAAAGDGFVSSPVVTRTRRLT